MTPQAVPRWAWAALAVVLVGAGVSVYAMTRDDEPTDRFCTVEGWLDRENNMYGRSGGQGCQFVDANGDLLRQVDGEPVCYFDGTRTGGPQVVSCDEPGARPPY